jgi:hypothetical protein
MDGEELNKIAPDNIRVPARTAWPLLLAFGLTTVAAGFVTNGSIVLLGGLLAVISMVGWFRAVLPHEQHESVRVAPETHVIATQRREIERVELAPEVRRAWIPLEIYPISAGVKGGLAGSVVMALLAMTYGLVSHGSIWYPINLLVAGGFPQGAMESMSQLTAFNLTALLLAIPLHLLLSLMVGLLYGAMLPMIPRSPILLGGFIAPLMWSGLVYAVLNIVDPVMNQRISWLWFVLSQLGFGLVAGIVVKRQQRIPTGQVIPFAVRAGMERSGLARERHPGDEHGDGDRP